MTFLVVRFLWVGSIKLEWKEQFFKRIEIALTYRWYMRQKLLYHGESKMP